jgi:hypothetical protein
MRLIVHLHLVLSTRVSAAMSSLPDMPSRATLNKAQAQIYLKPYTLTAKDLGKLVLHLLRKNTCQTSVINRREIFRVVYAVRYVYLLSLEMENMSGV